MKQPKLYDRQIVDGAGRASVFGRGVMGASDEYLEQMRRCDTDKARDAFVVNLSRSFASRLIDTWPDMYHALQRVKERELYKNPNWPGMNGRTYDTFKDFFENEIRRSFTSWSDLESTYLFVAENAPELLEKPLDAVRRIVATMAEQLKAKSEAAKLAAEQTTAPGKKAALEYMAEHPEATQAEVAKASGSTQRYAGMVETSIFDTSVENRSQSSRAKANGIGVVNQRKLDKLERHHPDLFARVRNGELTIHAASKQAGIQKPTYSLPMDPVTAGKYLAQRVDKEWFMACYDAFMKEQD